MASLTLHNKVRLDDSPVQTQDFEPCEGIQVHPQPTPMHRNGILSEPTAKKPPEKSLWKAQIDPTPSHLPLFRRSKVPNPLRSVQTEQPPKRSQMAIFSELSAYFDS